MLRDYAAELRALIDRARAKELAIAQDGAMLLPHLRQEKEKAAREALLASTLTAAKLIRADAEVKLKGVRADIARVNYPALTSSQASERTFGSAEWTAAQAVGQLYPLPLVERSVQMGRWDFVSALAERVQDVAPQNADDVFKRSAFIKRVNELYAERWKDLPENERVLTDAVARAGWVVDGIETRKVLSVLPPELQNMEAMQGTPPVTVLSVRD